jgi:hypothetical protein
MADYQSKKSVGEGFVGMGRDMLFGTRRTSETAFGSRNITHSEDTKRLGGQIAVTGAAAMVRGTLTGDTTMADGGRMTMNQGMELRQTARGEIAKSSAQDGLIARSQGKSAALGMRGVLADVPGRDPGFVKANDERTQTVLGQAAKPNGGTQSGSKSPDSGPGKDDYETRDGRNVQGTKAQQAAWAKRRSS